ncbi:MAG: DnaJ domain-containing protein [Candidatus Aminicenantes bacterium]|nr:DnaJ domain-containing protein [Candidatus Aminicenantes bacterium]
MEHIALYLKDIHLRKKSGRIAFSYNQIEKEFFFLNGYFVFSKTNISQERLGEILFMQGKISEEVYDKIDQYVKPKLGLGKALLNEGIITFPELRETLIYQIKEILFNIFPAFEGNITFTEEEDFVEKEYGTSIEIPDLIEEGIRGMSYSAQLKSFLEDRIPIQKDQKLLSRLQPEEKKIFHYLKGNMSSRAICDILGFPEDVYWKSLFLLFCLDMIVLREKPEDVKQEPEIESLSEMKKMPPRTQKRVQEKDEKLPEEEPAKVVKPAYIDSSPVPPTKEFPPLKPLESPPPPSKKPPQDSQIPVEKPPAASPPVQGGKEQTGPDVKPSAAPPESQDKELQEVLVFWQKMKHYDYFKMLGIPFSATTDDIKKAYFNMARKYHPDLFSRGVSPETKKKIEEVFDNLSKAFRTLSAPDKRREYEKKLQVLVDNGREDASKKAEHKYKQAKSLFDQDKYEETIILLEEAMRLKDDVAKYYFLLGLAESKITSSHKKAEEHFLRSIELDKWNPDAHVGLGLLYKNSGLVVKANRQFNMALEIDPDHAAARAELELTGKPDEEDWKSKVSRVFFKKKE